MKILQIATQVTVPTSDGGKKFVYGITKYLHLRGHKIDFVCYLRHDDYNTSFHELSVICNPHILKVKTDNNVFKALMNLFSPLPYTVSKYKTRKLRKYVVQLLSKKKFDIIQLEHSHLAWLIPTLRKYCDIPIVIRSPNLEIKILERFILLQRNLLLKSYAKLQYLKALKYEVKGYSQFDKCIMISKTDENELLKLNSDANTITIPPGIDPDLLGYKRKEVIPFSLVHIGHIDWYPNFDSLSWLITEIIPALVKINQNYHLYIYGGGKSKSVKIPDELRNNITNKGYVDNLWDELGNKALAIVPLRIGGGIRIKILEMLAVGMNILTTSVGCEGIEIIHKKHLLIADSKNEIINEVVSFFNGDYNTDQLRINGRTFISQNYIWDVIAENFEKEYMKLLSKESKFVK